MPPLRKNNSTTIDEVFSAFHPKAVRNQYRMTCPFRENHDASNDGSNSFFITPDINAYHCFSCGAKGSLLALLTVRLRLPFMAAFDMVSFDNIDRILNPKQRQLDLIDTIIPLDPPKAFVDRGFSERLLRVFKVGSIGDEIYIPRYDEVGNLVAIKHRIGRNFWYTPENFAKELELYNYHRVVNKHKKVIIVEGETDVYQSCKNGLWNVVAPSGGELTDAQVEMLAVFDEYYLAYDNDKAGTRYLEIAHDKLRYLGKPIHVMGYDADDPGKCGRTEWQRAYDEAIDYAEYTFMMSMELGEDYNSIVYKIKKRRIKNSKRL